jgi:hypothetical protein
MPRGSKPGERRGGRQRATPNRRTVLADRISVAASESPTASRRQLLTLLVKDRGLPADIRMAIGRPQRSRASRSQEPGAESHGLAKATAPLTLDVLFGIVQDVAASLSQRRWRRRCISCPKILAEAGLAPSLMTAALLSARKWPRNIVITNRGSENSWKIRDRSALRSRKNGTRCEHASRRFWRGWRVPALTDTALCNGGMTENGWQNQLRGVNQKAC